MYRGESRITILFIYLPTRVFPFEFLAQWEDAANSSVFSFVGVGKLYSGVRFSGSYYHAVSLLFQLLLLTIGVASRSISVGLIGHYQLARISRDDCHSTRYCRLFRDIPGMKCLLFIYIPLAFFERGGVTQHERQSCGCLYMSLNAFTSRQSGRVGVSEGTLPGFIGCALVLSRRWKLR